MYELLIEGIAIVLDYFRSQGLNPEQQMLALVGVSVGTGAAFLHPTLFAIKKTVETLLNVVRAPGKYVEGRREKRYLVEKERRDLQRELKALKNKMERQDEKMAALETGKSNYHTADLILEELEDADF